MKLSLKPKKRSAVSPVIATLLLIAIAVAAAIIVYAFVTGLIGGLTSSGASLVVVSGSLTVPSGSGAGTLVVTITNKASNAINYVTSQTDLADVGLTITYPVTPNTQDGGLGGAAAPGVDQSILCISNAVAANVPLLCQNAAALPVATIANAIPIGSEASAVGSAAGAVAGNTYTFSIYSYIGASTTPNIQTFSVTAQI